MLNDPFFQSFIAIATLDRRLRQNRDVGWVYIMRNRAFREPLLKIGKSSRPPMRRAAELGAATAVPEGFELVYFIHVSNHHTAEAHIHHELAAHRKARNKEFFMMPLPVAVQALERAAHSFPIIVGPRRALQVLPQPFQVVLFGCPHCGAKNRVLPLLVKVSVRCGACKECVDVVAE